jgi:hypothetical protein
MGRSGEPQMADIPADVVGRGQGPMHHHAGEIGACATGDRRQAAAALRRGSRAANIRAGVAGMSMSRFMDYAMPRAGDVPFFHFETKNVPSTTNPMGIKGGGRGRRPPRSSPPGRNRCCPPRPRP